MGGPHINLLQRVRPSQFLRHNAIFFTGALVVGGLNYVYYPVLGRLLPPSAFGEVQTLVSLFLQLTIFLNVLGMVTVTIVANARNTRAAQRTILDFEKAAVLISVGLLLLATLVSPWLKHFLQFDSGAPFVALGASLVASVPFTFRTAYLRGQQRFTAVSLANILAAGAKLVFSVVFVLAGLATFGAMLGLVGAQLFALGYAAYWARRIGLVKLSFKEYFLQWPSLKRLRPELKYAGLVLAVSLAITLQYSVDILFVKHYFDPHVAGLYAGIAAVARIIFFVTASIAQVMLPSVKLVHTPAQNRALLFKSGILLVGVGAPVWLACVAAPDLVVRVLMGNGYVPYAHLLPVLATAVFIISVLNLIMAYFTALHKHVVAIVGIMGSAVTFCLMLSWHNSLEAVVDSMFLGSLAMGGLLALWISGTKLKRGVHAAATNHDNRSGL